MKVTVAHLQSAVIVPGIKSTEVTLSETRIPGIRMELAPEGLFVYVRGKKALIPDTNIKIMMLDDEESPAKSSKAK